MRRLGGCPHAVHLLGLFEDDSHAHFVIELCTGGDLAHLLALSLPLVAVALRRMPQRCPLPC